MALLRPQTLDEVLGLLRDQKPHLIAGGTDFFPAKCPGDSKSPIMDITQVAGLRGIHSTQEEWIFGATTTWSDVAKADLPPAFDALKTAARQVGSVQIQNTGTIAGNICNASPAADGAPPFMVLDAQVEIGSLNRLRFVPLVQFITGPRQTVLDPGEMVLALHVPKTAVQGTSAFLKLGSRAYLVISIAMVAANVVIEAGRINTVRIAVGACAPKARRLYELEDRWRGMTLEQVEQMDINPDDLSLLDPIDDVRASADYRRHAAGVLCKRAVLMAGGRMAHV